MKKNKQIEVKNIQVRISDFNKTDYISLTDIARYKDSQRTDYIIQNWLRNRNNIEFLGIWEKLNNPDFKHIEFYGYERKTGLNSFILTSKQWIEKTKAVGLISKADCKVSGEIVSNHFVDVNKMVKLGFGAETNIEDSLI